MAQCVPLTSSVHISALHFAQFGAPCQFDPKDHLLAGVAQGVSMTKLPLMNEVARDNEVDCKVMMEIVRYLRANH